MNVDPANELVAQGVVERVVADPETARRNVDAAAAHLRAAASILAEDPTGAFVLAYDAMRKSIVGHMNANGLRVTSRPGAHHRTGRYARAALAAHVADDHLAAFDDLRRVRNKTEYDALVVNEATAREAIDHARAIVDAVERDLQ